MSVKNYSYLRRSTFRRLIWVFFSRALTFFIPDFILYYVGRLTTPGSRSAWREKVAIFTLYLFSAAFFCFWLEFVSNYFCDPEKTFEFDQVFSNQSKMSAIHGKVVDWRHLKIESPMVEWVKKYPHHDLSLNFPRFMMLDRPNHGLYSDAILNECLYYQNKTEQADAWLRYHLTHDPGYIYQDSVLTDCPMPNRRNASGSPCFYSSYDRAQLNSLPIKGANLEIQYNPDEISRLYNALPTPENPSRKAYVILDGYVLDVTAYLSSATTLIPLSSSLSSRAFSPDRTFLPSDLTLFLYINLGRDISQAFNGNVTTHPTLYRKCLIHLFGHGLIPNHAGCRRINPALWATMGIGLLYFLIKITLVYLSRVEIIQRYLFSSRPTQPDRSPLTLLLVPCFTESSQTLKQTLESLSRTHYQHKLLLFVCDGPVRHRGETNRTDQLLLGLLGYGGTDEPDPQAYLSLAGSNQARVYSGYYESGRDRVPYLVVVKVQNRGKRDSLLLVFGFLERCLDLIRHRISPLEYELLSQFHLLGIEPRLCKYLMVVDADIQVQSDVVRRLVARLEGEPEMLAVSGHVRPANPEQNLTTMIQIFPTYLAFFSSLAYEACLKSVMSIHGGLVMYKIWQDGRACCVHPTVLRGIATPRCNTMHMKNVLLLGEDKIVPIVLLQAHPDGRLGFEPDAVGYTTLPTNFFVLQGVQSRTLRAAFHTQLELQRRAWRLGLTYWFLSVAQLVDMIFSMPIMVYLYSVFVRALKQYGMAYMIIAWAFTGLALLHIVLFVLRRQFRYIVWFVLYCLISIPLFSIWFPILALWQSNDAEYWYDAWPIEGRGRARLHGIMDGEGTGEVRRERWADYEVAEAARLHEAAETALDMNFVGFTTDFELDETYGPEDPFQDPPVGHARRDPGLLVLDETIEDRASTLSISSHTFSVYNSTADESPQVPRHRAFNQRLEDSRQAEVGAGRDRAVHHQQLAQNSSHMNSRQLF